MDLPRLARSKYCRPAERALPPLRRRQPPSRIILWSNGSTIQRSDEWRFAPMSRPPYRALRIILGVFSALTAVGGLFMIFAGKPLIMRIFLRPPEVEVSTLLLFVLKEMGGFALMLTLMLFFASRDPVRNVAIVDAVIMGLVPVR